MCAGSNPAGGTSQKVPTDPATSHDAGSGVFLRVRAVRADAVGQSRMTVITWRPACRLVPAAREQALGVLIGQVGDAAGWWVAADAGVGSVVVVPVQPAGKRCLAFGF